MADFSALKAAIQAAIRQNGNNEITGNIMQGILLSMVNTLGDAAINALVLIVDELSTKLSNGYLFAGVINPSSSPSVGTGKYFFLSSKGGTYTNCGGIELPQGINIIMYNNGTWLSNSLFTVDDEPISGSNSLVKSGGVNERLEQLGYIQEDKEFLRVYTDNNGKLLWGIRKDGEIVYGAGIPVAIRKELERAFSELAELVLQLTNKVDKETGKSLINEVFANGVSYVHDPSRIYAIIDANNKVLMSIGNDGKMCLPSQALMEKIEDGNNIYKITDRRGNVLLSIDKNGNFYFFGNVPENIRRWVGGILMEKTQDPFLSNRNQESNLLAAARYNTSFGSCCQIMMVSDSHGASVSVRRASVVCKHIPSINSIIHLGDMVQWSPGEISENDLATTMKMLKESNKNYYMVCGNHDVGVVKYINFTRTHEEVYNDIVLPLIQGGMLKSGEYNTSGSWQERCYYYHDFGITKIRLIVLYDYDMELELDDNEYWEPVAYDSSKGFIEKGTTYTYDANNPIILNCGGWKENSFRLKKTVTTPNTSVDDTSGKFPWYKLRSFSWYSLEQMTWLANVLDNTPDGYGIVIASHQCPVYPALVTDNRFSIGSNPLNVYEPYSRVPGDTAMQVSAVMKIVKAWKEKASLNLRIVAKSGEFSDTMQYADYLNKNTDGSGRYAYIFSHDFLNRTNDNAFFLNFISGHEHCDIIVRSTEYPDMSCIITTCSNPRFRYMSDMPETEDVQSAAYDCLTVYACAKDHVALCKWGCDRTIAGVKRDFEIL